MLERRNTRDTTYDLIAYGALSDDERAQVDAWLIERAESGDVYAINTLGVLRLPGATDVLRALLGVPGDVGSAAGRALLGVTTDAIARVAEGARSGSEVESAFAAFDLKGIDDPVAIQGLFDALESRFLPTRVNALDGLKELLPASIGEPLQSPYNTLETLVMVELPAVRLPAAGRLRQVFVALRGGTPPAALGLEYVGGDPEALAAARRDLAADHPGPLAIGQLQGHDRQWAMAWCLQDGTIHRKAPFLLCWIALAGPADVAVLAGLAEEARLGPAVNEAANARLQALFGARTEMFVDSLRREPPAEPAEPPKDREGRLAGLLARTIMGRGVAFELLQAETPCPVHWERDPWTPWQRLWMQLVSPIPSQHQPAGSEFQRLFRALEAGEALPEMEPLSDAAQDLIASRFREVTRAGEPDLALLGNLKGQRRAWAEAYLIYQLALKRTLPLAVAAVTLGPAGRKAVMEVADKLQDERQNELRLKMFALVK